MAHFAEIGLDNIVQRVIVVHDSLEAEGAQWCAANYGGRWVQTSYNARIRKHYAGQGFTYDEQRDAFIPPKPYPSWLLNESTCTWEAPIPMPMDGALYVWEEQAQAWAQP